MLLSLQHNIHFIAKHVPGVLNTAVDMLSRLQVTEYQARFPHMQSRLRRLSDSESNTSCMRNSLSPSTLSAYKSAFVTYRDFINMHFGSGVNPSSLSLQHLSACIANCFLRKLAASSTRTLVSS